MSAAVLPVMQVRHELRVVLGADKVVGKNSDCQTLVVGLDELSRSRGKRRLDMAKQSDTKAWSVMETCQEAADAA